VILGAALLVLVALALFVGGMATGATALYWACVAVSAVAAVLLVLARRQVTRPAAGEEPRAPVAPRTTTAPPPPVRTGVPEDGAD
jgi:membrane protein implicated in regulation of membrane protease activity